MKKLFCCFLLLMLMMSSALAAPRVSDEAHLLTNEEIQKLTTRADEISARYNVDVIVHTTNNSRGMVLGMYAADIVDYNDYLDDNIILAVAMDQRKYVCVTTGRGIYAFTDYALDVIYDEMEDDMVNGYYMQAFDRYLELCDRVLKQAELGAPYDYDLTLDTRSTGEIIGMRLLFAFVPAFLIAWAVAASKKRSMKTDRAQESAHSYLTNMRLTNQRDIYLYTNTVRRRIESDSSSGGSSTFSGSSGKSHGGGGSGRSF